MIKQSSRKVPTESGLSALHPYSACDPMPVPEVYESNGDAAWALWEYALSSTVNGTDADFKPTVSAELLPFLFYDSLKSNR
jgi:hypothetical protein